MSKASAEGSLRLYELTQLINGPTKENTTEIMVIERKQYLKNVIMGLLLPCFAFLRVELGFA